MWFLLNISRTWPGYCFPVSLNALKLLHGVGLVCTEPLPNGPVHITWTVLVFSSTSSYLTFAVPASVSQVLWETTQTYPEELRGAGRGEGGLFLGCVPLFLVVLGGLLSKASPFSCWICVKSLLSWFYIAFWGTWKNAPFLNWGDWQSLAWRGWRSVCLGFDRKQRFLSSWT